MKLLIIEDTYRQWLSDRRAIGFDSDLNEKLAGLTHEESVTYIARTNNAGQCLSQYTDAELEHFVRLHELHNASTEFIAGPYDITFR